MTEATGASFDELVERLDELLIPFIGRVQYGNLRRKVTEWGDGDERTRNLAVIYESPGGSTNQVNIMYLPTQDAFTTVDPETGKERQTKDIAPLLELIGRHAETIPGYRAERLHQMIDEWVSDGYQWPHVLAVALGEDEIDAEGIQLGSQFVGGFGAQVSRVTRVHHAHVVAVGRKRQRVLCHMLN